MIGDKPKRSLNVKTLARIAISLLPALVAPLAQAAPTSAPAPQAPPPNWYNVELIVFRATDPGAGGLETWPLDPGAPDWNGAQPLVAADSTSPPLPYQSPAPGADQLNDAWTRLKRSKNYDPLLHLSWTQPALDRSAAQWVRVGAPPTAAPMSPTRALAAANSVASAPMPSTPVFGEAKLSTTGPYLHFDLDLVLQGPLARIPTPAVATGPINTATLAPLGATAPAPTFQYYRLQQDRRVDGGKLTYFDHPLFGVILLVTPVRHSALTPGATPTP